MTLKTNMHFLCTVNESDAIEQKEFANWLLKIGKGQIPTIDGLANQFSGKTIEYFSADAIKEQSNSEYQYPIEF
ncbi:unnamed protein product [Rhizophagus irregularis]|uniref:Uncharacterized protein n=1 Tax=Rhizophagus irregularis TaxID=588596 RepID=A0A915ZD53_9GLOM|nr:unnamed protein product [Rhizophagus irregularis]